MRRRARPNPPAARWGPTARLATQLPGLLQQVSEAARSIRELADFLERHPEALLRGRHEATT